MLPSAKAARECLRRMPCSKCLAMEGVSPALAAQPDPSQMGAFAHLEELLFEWLASLLAPMGP